MLVIPFLELERIINITLNMIWRSLRSKIDESKRGWYHHLKVEYVRLYFKEKKDYCIRKTHWVQINIPVLGRN